MIQLALDVDRNYGNDQVIVPLNENEAMLVNVIMDSTVNQIIYALLRNNGSHLTCEIFLSKEGQARARTNESGDWIEDKSNELYTLLKDYLDSKKRAFKIEKI